MNKKEIAVQKALGTIVQYHIYFKGPLGGIIYNCIIDNVTSIQDAIKKAYTTPPLNGTNPAFPSKIQRLQKSHQFSWIENKYIRSGCKVNVQIPCNDLTTISITIPDLRYILTKIGKLRKKRAIDYIKHCERYSVRLQL